MDQSDSFDEDNLDPEFHSLVEACQEIIWPPHVDDSSEIPIGIPDTANLEKILEYLKKDEAQIQDVFHRGDSILGDTAALYALSEATVDRTERMQLLLEWEGPKGEFFDPRSGMGVMHLENPLHVACRTGCLKMIQFLLKWRGPNGEFINPNDSNCFSGWFSWYGFDESYDRYQNLSEDRRKVVKKIPEIAQILIAWEGPTGEFYDPSRDDYLKGNWKKSCNSSFSELYEILLKWESPTGTKIDWLHLR